MNQRSDTHWGKDPHPLVSLDAAWSQIAAEVLPMRPEAVRLSDAGGRVLAETISAGEDHPPFDKAMMDGFAVRADDCQTPGAALELVGLVRAGETASASVGRGRAMQINTGAPVPNGADAVVRVEDTSRSDEGRTVVIHVTVPLGRNIAVQGHDRRKGDVVLTPPLVLGPAQISAAAAAGAGRLMVAPQVGVAVVVTGDELVPAGEAKSPGQIDDSNGPMLAALMRQFGALPHVEPITRDTKGDLRARFTEALKQPVVLAVGGMSMGTLDLVPRALQERHVTWRFHGVAIRPGKPVAYGRGPEGQHVFGLPGNPVSAFVGAWLFVRMAVRGLMGFMPRPPQRRRARLAEDLPPGRDDRIAFIPARVWTNGESPSTPEGVREPDHWILSPVSWGGSGDPYGLAAANALLVRHEPDRPLQAGSVVEYIAIALDAES